LASSRRSTRSVLPRTRWSNPPKTRKRRRIDHPVLSLRPLIYLVHRFRVPIILILAPTVHFYYFSQPPSQRYHC
jgi:hypothetical protein